MEMWRKGNVHIHGFGTSLNYWSSQFIVVASTIALIVRAILLRKVGYVPATMLSTISLILAWTTAIPLNHFQHRQECRSSDIILALYLFSIIGSAINIRTMTLLNQHTQGQFRAFLAFVVFNTVGLIVEAWPRGQTEVQRKGTASRSEKANLFSRILFHYMQPLILQGFKAPLSAKDIMGVMPQRIKTENSYGVLNSRWEKAVEKSNAHSKNKRLSLFWTILITNGWSLIHCVIFRISASTCNFVPPVLLSKFLGFIGSYSTSRPQPVVLGVILAFGMFFATLVGSLFAALYVQNAMIYEQIGWSVFVGLAAAILMMPIQALLARFLTTAKSQKLKAMDERILLMNEILASIKTVKLYGWEDSFKNRVTAFRNRELSFLHRIGCVFSVLSITFRSMSLLISLVSFWVYASAGGPDFAPGEITPQRIFVSITLIDLLNRNMSMISQVITTITGLTVATRRIQKFLLAEEISENSTESIKTLPDDPLVPLVEIKDGIFAWGTEGLGVETEEEKRSREKMEDKRHRQLVKEALKAGNPVPERQVPTKKSYDPVLKGIHLTIARGSLTAVVGRVGQGKSSLLHAIIGDIYKRRGSVQVYGRIAHVAQQAWIVNATVKENIVFGYKFDQARYDSILMACALLPDIERLPAGSFYQLVNEYSVVKSSNRQEEAKSTVSAGIEELINDTDDDTDTSTDDEDGKDAKTLTIKKDDKGLLTEEEEMVHGNVARHIYRVYAKAASYKYSILVICLFIFMQSLQIGTNIWLKHWANVAGTGRHTLAEILAVYIILVASYIATNAIVTYIVNRFSSDVYNIDEYMPVNFIQFIETLAGVTTIRAFAVQDRFIHENATKADASANAYFSWMTMNRWLQIRLESLGALVVLAAALFAILRRQTLGAANVGLQLAYAMSVTQTIAWLVRSYCDLNSLPASLAVPWQTIADMLEIQPVLTHAAVVMWNRRLLDKDWPRVLSNMDTLVTFSGSSDESWFYLVTTAIEATGAPVLDKILTAIQLVRENNTAALNQELERFAENMAVAGLLNGVRYVGIDNGEYKRLAGGSAAQSSLIHALDIAFGVEHHPPGLRSKKNTEQTNGATPIGVHSASTNGFMPVPKVRNSYNDASNEVANIRQHVKDKACGDRTDPQVEKLIMIFDECVHQINVFRDVHIQMLRSKGKLERKPVVNPAKGFSKRSSILYPREFNFGAPHGLAKKPEEGNGVVRGTGGTDLIPFLRQFRNETSDSKIVPTSPITARMTFRPLGHNCYKNISGVVFNHSRAPLPLCISPAMPKSYAHDFLSGQIANLVKETALMEEIDSPPNAAPETEPAWKDDRRHLDRPVETKGTWLHKAFRGSREKDLGDGWNKLCARVDDGHVAKYDVNVASLLLCLSSASYLKGPLSTDYRRWFARGVEDLEAQTDANMYDGPYADYHIVGNAIVLVFKGTNNTQEVIEDLKIFQHKDNSDPCKGGQCKQTCNRHTDSSAIGCGDHCVRGCDQHGEYLRGNTHMGFYNLLFKTTHHPHKKVGCKNRTHYTEGPACAFKTIMEGVLCMALFGCGRQPGGSQSINLWITGHSLGGALASLCMARLQTIVEEEDPIVRGLSDNEKKLFVGQTVLDVMTAQLLKTVFNDESARNMHHCRQCRHCSGARASNDDEGDGECGQCEPCKKEKCERYLNWDIETKRMLVLRDCYTFASPKVGNGTFAQQFERNRTEWARQSPDRPVKAVESQYWRVVVDDDPVPNQPPAFAGYQHAGELCPAPTPPTRFQKMKWYQRIFEIAKSPVEWYGGAHYAATYYDSLSLLRAQEVKKAKTQ
ncbi:hypothetical protein KVV02_004552 [Mortierella alpina]|uniref:Uncharacterized protein n=1 Tax=Mortierella alpina TaxID=64518 RepID=A0A9P8CUD6_MORAP|nr:hypothetical protein KVV02_004552 [Mortierella alpina]